MPEKMRFGHDNGLDDLLPQILVDVERGQEGGGAPEPAAPDLLGDRPLHHGKAVHRKAEAEAAAERREEAVGNRRRRRSAPHGAKSPVASMAARSEEHTSELQSLMRISYAVFCLKNKQPTIQ